MIRYVQRIFSIKAIRFLIQAVFLLFILVILLRQAVLGEDSASASAEAYCPLGGLETLYKYFTSSSSSFLSHLHMSSIILFAGVVLLALFTRSSFCGWICPIGTIQEWIRKLAKRIGIAPRFSLAQRLGKWDGVLQWSKYVLLVWIVLGTIYYGTLIFRDYDPYAGFIQLVDFDLTAGGILFILMLISSLFAERPWCRYFCPLGAVIGMTGKISLIKIKRDPAICKSCDSCSRACPSNIPVSKLTQVNQSVCISCLSCIDACHTPRALGLSTSLPIPAKKDLSAEADTKGDATHANP